MSDIFFPQRYKELAAEYDGMTLCRVVLQEKGMYRVAGEFGERRASVSGKLRYSAVTPSDYPAVGDYVMASDDGGMAVIRHVLPRKSVFIRKAAGRVMVGQVVAANVDTLFLCMALNNDFSIRRLERYMAVARESGAEPVVVLTKADLCDTLDDMMAKVRDVAAGADIVVTCAFEENGYACIAPYISAGKTVAFVGSSGVGKSTLINRLLGEDRLGTGGLRNDDKGRHTTTHRELLQLENGATVIDTPGMRELGMWGTDEGIHAAFADIEELASKCRFNNCTHGNEPGCAVRSALESGELSPERWQSYRKLAAENARVKDMGSIIAAKEKKFDEISRINKANRNGGRAK